MPHTARCAIPPTRPLQCSAFPRISPEQVVSNARSSNRDVYAPWAYDEEVEMPTLFDAPRCPYCARVRIVLAEKSISYETAVVDLDARPDWIRETNPPDGRVPVLAEDDETLIPESRVIMQYLEETTPEPALMPDDALGRAAVGVWLERFDARLGGPYYRARRDASGPAELEELARSLEFVGRSANRGGFLAGPAFSLADIGYVPWVLRAEMRFPLDVRAVPGIGSWLERLEERPAIAAESAVVGAL